MHVCNICVCTYITYTTCINNIILYTNKYAKVMVHIHAYDFNIYIHTHYISYVKKYAKGIVRSTYMFI